MNWLGVPRFLGRHGPLPNEPDEHALRSIENARTCQSRRVASLAQAFGAAARADAARTSEWELHGLRLSERRAWKAVELNPEALTTMHCTSARSDDVLGAAVTPLEAEAAAALLHDFALYSYGQLRNLKNQSDRLQIGTFYALPGRHRLHDRQLFYHVRSDARYTRDVDDPYSGQGPQYELGFSHKLFTLKRGALERVTKEGNDATRMVNMLYYNNAQNKGFEGLVLQMKDMDELYKTLCASPDYQAVGDQGVVSKDVFPNICPAAIPCEAIDNDLYFLLEDAQRPLVARLQSAQA